MLELEDDSDSGQEDVYAVSFGDGVVLPIADNNYADIDSLIDDDDDDENDSVINTYDPMPEIGEVALPEGSRFVDDLSDESE